MVRSSLVLVVLLGGAVAASAQDMPLAQILIPGEGWKKVDGAGPRPSPGGAPTTLSRDRSTVFSWRPGEWFLHAAQVPPKGEPISRAPYAPLRLGIGAKETEVTSLTTDRDGRIYAATPVGIKVFDPTGRLCGVLRAPAAGKSEHLAFDGDQLTVWVGDAKYTRTLRTKGVK